MQPILEPILNKRIYVAGHRGMVGQAVVRALRTLGVDDLILADRTELDLCDQQQTNRFFEDTKPEIVIFAAGKVGGIIANSTYPAEFLYQNLMMAAHAVEAAYRTKVNRFLYLGSSCIYPRLAEQPIREESLLSGPLEATNEAYALAKISGLKLCQFYRHQYGVLFHSAMPTNLYGPGDNYHPQNSHVVPALIRRFHEAKIQGADQVQIWGTGNSRRELMHVDDLADGLLHLCQVQAPPDWINVGIGKDISILELAHKIARTVGFSGRIVTNPDKPDGTPVKCTDISKIKAIGWNAKIDLDTGLAMTYHSFLKEFESGGLRDH